MPVSTGSQPEAGLNTVAVTASSEVPAPNVAKHSFRTKYLKRVANSSTLRGLLDQGVSSVGPLKAIGDLVDCIVNPEDILSGKREYEALKEELDKTLETLALYDDGTASPTITATIERLCEDIKKDLQSVEAKINQDGLGRFRKESADVDEVLRCYDRIRDRLQRVSLNVDILMWKIIDSTAMDNRLDRLRPVMSACYNSAQAVEIKRGPCTKGTRTDVLDRILGWIGTPNPGSVYWLSGMAGTGKTTISYTLCKELESSGRLAANFFCSRLLPECRDVSRIIPSIAYQLARFSYPFQFALSRILEKNPDAHTRELDFQFNTLIVQPLLIENPLFAHRSVKDTLPPNLFVLIDALDECESKKSTSQILDLLLKKSSNLPIRFIVSSRPEPDICNQMTKQIGQYNSQTVLHELDREVVQTDIETYMRSSLAQMQLSKEQIMALVERAGVLFIHAAILVRYISHDNFQGNSRTRLETVLKESAAAGKQHKDIDELYATVVQAALENSDLEDVEKEDIRQVLHTVICAKEPLTVNAISRLLKMNDTERVHAAIRPLRSVLHVSGENELVTTLHASFPEYMLDPSRSKKYHCEAQSHHQILALRCLDYFRDMQPQFNICGLESSFVPDKRVKGLENRVNQVITTELFYAARYWAIHLHSATGSPELMRELEEFLSARLLLWMEVMNLKGCTHEMPKATRLAEICDTNTSDTLKALVRDACWFTATFASGSVSDSTPHIYTSMLPFWPKSNPISCLYIGRTQGMTAVSGTAITSRQHTLAAAWYLGGETRSPCFSPDGTQIVLGVDNNVLLLNASTGQKMVSPFVGHHRAIRSVRFSPDGTQIVSGSDDKTIRIWNTHNGESTLGPLEGHSHSIVSVDFSPNGSRIVSGSLDGTICIWDTYNGALLFNWLKVHHGLIRAQYLPDASHIVSIGEKPGIVVWNSETGRASKEFGRNVLEDSISSGDISPNGSHVVSGSDNNAVYLWDIRTGHATLGSLTDLSLGPASYTTSITFSRDQSRIVSGSSDGTVCMWDVQTGELVIGPLVGHTNCITALGSSPNSAYIVSGSPDMTLRLWDTRKMQTALTLVQVQGHTGSVQIITISPDGARVGSGSEDGTVCVWDAETGDLIVRIPRKVFARVKWPKFGEEDEEEYPEMLGMGFSSDSIRIIINTSHGPFVFNAKTGSPCNIQACRIPPKDLFFFVIALSFVIIVIALVGSPPEWKPGDNSLVGSNSPWLSRANYALKGIKLAMAGLKMDFGLHTPANAHSALIIQAGLIAITVFCIFSDTIFGMVDIHLPHISCADFSFDGTKIVSSSTDGIVRVHDAYTNRLTLTITLPNDNDGLHPSSVIFSSDARRIFSSSGGRRPQVYCAHSGKLLVDLNDSEWEDVVGLSPDGTLVVIERPGSISLLNLDTLQSVGLNLARRKSRGSCLKWSVWRLFTFSADGSSIASISGDNSIGIWSTQTGKQFLEPIKLNVPKVQSMAYFPDGGRIATGSCDGTICITDVQSKLERPTDGLPTNSDWEMTRGGWVVDNQSRPLVWVPPELRTPLTLPRTRGLISRRGWLKLDFKDAYLGEEWTKCYKPE